MDAHKNFSYGRVSVAPSPATSGTSLTLQTGEGALMPATPFNATVWPMGDIPKASTAEIVRVTNVVGDVVTMTRAQESTSAKSIAIGWQFAATITAKVLTDIEASVAPPGTIIEYAGVTEPAGGNWLFANGGAISRATYSAMLAAITDQQTCTTVSGSSTLTVQDSSRIKINAPVEGTYIPAGTTVTARQDATHVTLSANATGNGTNTLRFFPWGNGDGSTTFNKPDKRGRTGVGRGTHADVAAVGHQDSVTLANRTPNVSHTHTSPSHSHTTPNHQHTIASHTHTTPAHTHSIADHSHTTPNHQHTIASHTHSTPAHAHTLSGHTHNVTTSEAGQAIYNVGWSGASVGTYGSSAPSTDSTDTSGSGTTGGSGQLTSDSGGGSTTGGSGVLSTGAGEGSGTTGGSGVLTSAAGEGGGTTGGQAATIDAAAVPIPFVTCEYLVKT